MSLVAIDYLCSGTFTSINSYDSTKWNLGSLIRQTTGTISSNNFISPVRIAQTTPSSDTLTFSPAIIDGFTWSNNIDWIFGASVSNRQFGISMWEYNRTDATYSYRGYQVTSAPTGSGGFVLRGFSALYYTHTTGTVSVTSSAVTGNGTLFQTQRIASGARIGFGTIDPTLVSTWYTIGTISSNSSIVMNASVPTQLTNVPYVIEELRFAFAVTNVLAGASGGVFLSKGRNYNNFTTSTANIVSTGGASTSVDNQPWTYWISDGLGASTTVSNTFATGIVVDGNKRENFDGLTHSAYVIDVTSTRAYVYNLRASDPIALGKMTLTQSSIQRTLAQPFVTTLLVNNNGVIATPRHWPVNDEKSLFFLSSNRFYRSKLSKITNDAANWFQEARAEIPPGSVNTTPAALAFNYVDYDSVSDTFLIFGSASNRSFFTKFPKPGQQLDNIFMYNAQMLDSPSATPSSVSLPYNNLGSNVFSRTLGGITHLFRSTTFTMSAIFAIPLSCHWDYTNETNQVAISPVIPTPNNKNLFKVIINYTEILGSEAFETPLNDIRVLYRTDGFENNSGIWYKLPADGDLSGLGFIKKIQLRFEFQMVGNCWGLPGRLLGFTVIYDDLSTQANHQPSVLFTTNKTFAWRFAATYSSTLPNLRVRLFNAETNDLLVDDNTASPKGTFEKTTNASTWTAWDNLDRTNDTTYIRYTPTSLMDGLKIRAVLTFN